MDAINKIPLFFRLSLDVAVINIEAILLNFSILNLPSPQDIAESKGILIWHPPIYPVNSAVKAPVFCYTIGAHQWFSCNFEI